MTDVIGTLIQKEIENELVEKAKAIAKRLLKRGIAINAISEDTGLDVEVIEGLQEELEQDK